jgi:TonB family protein
MVFKGDKMKHNERNLENPDELNRVDVESPEDFFKPQLSKLPRQFHKSLSERFDKRFLSILVISVAFHFMVAIYFVLNPPSEESNLNRIGKIQKRLAKSIMEREVQLEEPVAQFRFTEDQPIEEEEKELESETSPETKESKRSSFKKSASKTPTSKESRRAAFRRGSGGAGGRGKTQEEIASVIGSKGILALLTSTSSVATGAGVEDILTRAGDAQQDLDEALSGVSGLKRGGQRVEGSGGVGNGSGGLKGGRAQDQGGIDDLVAGLGSARSTTFERSGDLVVMGESRLVQGSGEKAIVGRNQDDVQAVVTRHNNAIQYCYERELKRNPNLRGKLVLRITITPQGTVKKVKIISSTLNNRRVEQCVISRIKRWSDFGSIDPKFGNITFRQTYAFGY